MLFILSLVSCRECLNLGTCKHKTGRRSIGRDSLTRHSQFHLSASTTSNLSINANKNNNDPSNTPPYTLSKPQSVYVALTTLFVTCLIVADVIGMKIFEVKLPFSILGFNRIEHTCGMLTFPVTFLIGDIVNEYFGPKATKATVYLGLTMSLFVFIVINIATALPFLDKPFNSKNHIITLKFIHLNLNLSFSFCCSSYGCFQYSVWQYKNIVRSFLIRLFSGSASRYLDLRCTEETYSWQASLVSCSGKYSALSVD